MKYGLCLSAAFALLGLSTPALAAPWQGSQVIRDSSGQVLHRTEGAVAGVRELNAGVGARAVLWEEDGVGFFRASVDGGASYGRVSPVQAVVPMVRASFDPLEAQPDFTDSPLTGGGNLYLVQFEVTPLEAFREAVRARGGRVHRYAGGQTHIVELASEQVPSLESLDFVRWVGEYHPEYRLESEVLAQLSAGALRGAGDYQIQVTERGSVAKDRVAARIAALGGEVVSNTPSGFLLRAKLNPAQLAQVLRSDDVIWIDRWSEPRSYMDKVRVDGGANFLENATGFTGQGVRGEVLDFACYTQHPELQTPPVIVHNATGPGGFHGTEVTGIVFSDGSGNASARGLLPDAQAIFSTYTQLGDRYAHTAELLQAPYFASFQTNSWGPGIGNGYNNSSFELDDITFLYDITIMQAMGNSGSAGGDWYAWSKNVISCGAVNHQGTQSLADDQWANSGSSGPATDSRIKPDLSFWYDNIGTTAGQSGYTGGFGGTSAATPTVAGHVGLFLQMWHNGIFGNVPAGATPFDSRPKSTLVRAMMINGADSYDFSGVGDDLSRFNQGWGRADVERLHELRDKLFFVEETEVLPPLGSATYQLDVLAGEPELRATMVYLDPAGTTSSSQHRINDLTLRVTSPSGVAYWGNKGLKAGNASTTGGAANTVDPVENVRVPNPEPGTWTVEIFADEVVQDAHVETPALDADFALVVSGVQMSAACGSAVSYCTAGVTTHGCKATMSASGVASATAASGFDLMVTGAEGNNLGQFFWGSNGRQANPWGNSTSFNCVIPPVKRGGVLAPAGSSGGCNGDYTQDLNAHWTANPGKNPGAGATVQAQFWFRDPLNTSNQTTALSDGLEFTVCP